MFLGEIMSIQQLEDAVIQLTTDELDAFARWFENYLADAWDSRIAADAAEGRLDAMGRKADADYEAGRCTPL